ncbi:hypothetical protein ACOZ35_04130 [Halorubrum xinjiangense]|uniref:hypothetical protein n=1 Tax=Halorubrum xinjiangense TaxID=261291 RepID=UPI003C701271
MYSKKLPKTVRTAGIQTPSASPTSIFGISNTLGVFLNIIRNSTEVIMDPSTKARVDLPVIDITLFNIDTAFDPLIFGDTCTILQPYSNDIRPVF